MQLDLVGHRSDPQVAWARLGDTDFMNRLVGGGEVALHLEPRSGQPPEIRGVLTGPLGLPMPFVETRFGWVWQRWFHQTRSYPHGPLAENRYSLRLERDGDGVIPHILLSLEPRNRWVRPLVAAVASRYRAGWKALLDALPPPGQPAAPALRRTLGPDAQGALKRWRELGSGAWVDTMERLFREERMMELQKMRPAQLADRMGFDRQQTLREMLCGVTAGAVELFWSVRCGRCHGQVAATTALSDLADHARCSSCQLDVAVDLGRSVEVVFAPHPAVMPRIAQRHCSFFPAGAPTQRVRVLLQPGEALDEHLALPVGRWRLGDGQREVEVRVGRTGGGRALQWPGAEVQEVGEGQVRIHAVNTASGPRVLELTEAEPGGAWISAAQVASVPEFRRALGPQVLAPNLRIGSRRVALLFTDLSGSTALYEKLGDAPAFALVRDHFRLLDREIARHGGERVKTMGDAVMASFPTARQAMAAAVSMQQAFDRWKRELDVQPAPRLNVGVHEGLALAVHTDSSGLDWFGRTVNLAARAQAAAREGALVWTEAVMAAPGVAALVEAQARPIDQFQASLKGIGTVTLHRMAPHPEPSLGSADARAPEAVVSDP